MKHFIRKHPRLWPSLRSWALVIGVLTALEVTGWGTEIRGVKQTPVRKAGIFDVIPAGTTAEPDFPYDFAVKDLAGRHLAMSDLRGKVIFLNLWATWCGPCRAEMPSIQKLYETLDHDRIAFVMLSLDQPNHRRKITRFIEQHGYTFPVYQPASPLPDLLRVRIVPTTFIVSPDGEVVHTQTGMADYDTGEIREFLKGLYE